MATISSLHRVFRRHARSVADRLLKPLDVKLVNRARTPRGFLDALRRMKQAGVDVRHIVDVGASDGSWTRQCMGVFPNASYHLIEALEIHRSALEQLRSTTCGQVDYSICTVGPEESTAVLYEHGNQTSVLPSEYTTATDATSRSVTLRTIDSLVPADRLQGTALLKLDVQGFEIEVLRGAARTLANADLQLLLAEVSYRRIYDSSPLAHEVIQFAADHGFRIFDICSYCPRPHDLELAQSDILFVHQNCDLFRYEGWN